MVRCWLLLGPWLRVNWYLQLLGLLSLATNLPFQCNSSQLFPRQHNTLALLSGQPTILEFSYTSFDIVERQVADLIAKTVPIHLDGCFRVREMGRRWAVCWSDC